MIFKSQVTFDILFLLVIKRAFWVISRWLQTACFFKSKSWLQSVCTHQAVVLFYSLFLRIRHCYSERLAFQTSLGDFLQVFCIHSKGRWHVNPSQCLWSESSSFREQERIVWDLTNIMGFYHRLSFLQSKHNLSEVIAIIYPSRTRIRKTAIKPKGSSIFRCIWNEWERRKDMISHSPFMLPKFLMKVALKNILESDDCFAQTNSLSNPLLCSWGSITFSRKAFIYLPVRGGLLSL